MNTETYSLSNIPDRDKYLLRPYHDKAQFIREFPAMMSEHRNDYDLYFVTFTFTDLKSRRAYSCYREFFCYFRQRLDTALLPNSRALKKAPFLFLFPEQNPQTHFHGILFLHKQTSKNFQKKCILDIEHEHNDKLYENVSSIRLKQKFINPYPKAISCQHEQAKIIRTKRCKERTAYQKELLYTDKQIIKVADYKIYPISSPEQQMKSFSYSVKNFISSRFTPDDIIIETKDKSD